MITLKRLNGQPFQLNALYIEQVSSNPDTTITLTNGKMFVVLEKEDEVQQKIIDFYRVIQLFAKKELYEEKEE